MRFKTWDCDLKYGVYGNGNTAIQLIDSNDGQPIATATVNPPEEFNLEQNQVVIKDYSENEGMLKSLINEGIVKDTGEIVELGFTFGNICELLGKAND